MTNAALETLGKYEDDIREVVNHLCDCAPELAADEVEFPDMKETGRLLATISKFLSASSSENLEGYTDRSSVLAEAVVRILSIVAYDDRGGTFGYTLVAKMRQMITSRES